MDLLKEYQDNFAQNEFDLGSFTDIEHSVDTGSAPPIKQRMRRTHLDDVQEGKKTSAHKAGGRNHRTVKLRMGVAVHTCSEMRS